MVEFSRNFIWKSPLDSVRSRFTIWCAVLVHRINKMGCYYLSKEHIFVLWKTIGTDYAFSALNSIVQCKKISRWLRIMAVFSPYWLLSWCFAVIQYHNKLNYVHKTAAVRKCRLPSENVLQKYIPLLQFSLERSPTIKVKANKVYFVKLQDVFYWILWSK